ncbi:MAG: PIG-L family deacetylase [Rhodothermales bacterium]
MKSFALVFTLLLTASAAAQPEVPVEQWTGKTILLVGAHPDDDTYSHGTLSLLQKNGNDIYVLLLTSGNVGTKDPDMTTTELAQIRRQEEINALAQVGIPEDHYFNLGYTDGMLEFADREEVVKRIVYYIRKLQPDVLFAFDPGKQEQRWHKSDHRSAAYLAADATRAAEWPLLFEEHIIYDKLQPRAIPEFMFYDGAEEDVNTWVDISGHVDNKVNAAAQYISQFTSAWDKYTPDIPASEKAALVERLRQRVRMQEGKPVEGFRYYKGIPDGMGR